MTDEQQMIVDTVRSFVEKELYPLEDEIERSGHVSPDVGDEIKRKVLELGFYAPNMPEEVGGGGLNNLDFALLPPSAPKATGPYSRYRWIFRA